MRSRRPASAGAPERNYDALHVGALAAAVSIAFFRNFYTQGAILLYGDGVAHIHIARRVFDSITPGPLQLGTVWLPLPHVLMMPFVVSDWMWRTGVGGSVVSIIAYIAGTVGVFRLLRRRTSRGIAWLGAAIYALNPNLIYMQATAMTESLYLALFVWVAVCLDEALDHGSTEAMAQRSRWLERSAVLVAAAMLTRYDGWWLAGCVLAGGFAVGVFEAIKHRDRARELFSGLQYRRMRIAVRNAVLLLAAIPALWLAYNYREYGNSLEFATGPYSARGIEQRTGTAAWRHPGSGSVWVAGLYFVKSVKLNLGTGHWEWPLLALAAAGLVLSLTAPRSFAAWWLLWIPVPFYALSIAYGGVPLFLPVWWPFSYYNLRYGLELLPAVAVFGALAVEMLRRGGRQYWWRFAVGATAVLVVGGSYISVWRSTPVCLREAVANSRTRLPFERALAESLRQIPPSARLLMYSGEHPGALQMADIHGTRVVDETNHPQWEQALHDPSAYVDYVVASDNDAVTQSAAHHGASLQPVAIVESSGQPRTTIYKTQRATRP